MTDKEKKDIIDAVLLQIQNNSQSVDTLQLADSLNGVSSLPCVKGEELVSVPLSLFEKIVSDTAASSASGAIIEETNARISADANLQAQITETKDGNAELLKRIKGTSTASSAYTDPFKHIGNFASEKDESGTVTKNAILVMQDALLDTLRHSDYRDSFPYIGHMRAHIEGVPIEMWTYVKAWNTGSTNGVFVQVVRTNFGLKNGVISSALTESFHEYFRTVTVSMANGSVTDVTATVWKESTVTTEQAKKLNIITYLGHYSTRDALLAAAAKINVVQLSSDNSVRILYGTYTEGSTNSVLILQHNTRTGAVSESGRGTTMQYVFDGKERYTRYIDHNASSVTAVQPLQLEGVRNLYFTPKGFIGLRDMWGTQVGSGFFLPDNTAIREDAANTTATSVGLIITSFLGTTKTATIGAVTSARAGLMTVALYNELKQATAGVAAEETARINLGNQIAADIQSIYKRLAAADAELSASISAEEAARTQRDAELTAVITAETNTRLTADSDEKEARETADDELSGRITSEAAAREASDAELQAKIQDHEDRIWKLENQWYGIEWDTEVSSPAVTRIGNMDLHRTLPIQSRMRGCLLNDNGKVVEYLNEKDWTGHDLSGARGQVMVEIPYHYRRFETDGTKRRVKMSEYPLPGFNFVKIGYLSANEATIQRSTGKLASVVNSDPDFRGGNNQAEFDGTYKSVLGKPANYISLRTARDAARKRGKEGDTQWNCYTYDIHVTLTWLYVVEYANRNSQLPFTAELTSEGFHQGGLGSFSIPNADYKSYFPNLPVIPCGCTHQLGNGTGVVNLHLATDDGTYQRDILVPRYRGVEVPFGHLFILSDGIFGQRADTSSAWTYYATSDPSVFGSDDTTQYRVVGLSPSSTHGYIKDINFGEQGDITTSQSSGGSSTTFFCDFYEIYYGTKSTLCFCGCIYNNDNTRCGFFYCYGTYNESFTSYEFTTRLCFLPAE